MPNYKINCKSDLSIEVLTGLLWQWPLDSVMEEENGASGYISEDKFSESLRMDILKMEQDFPVEISIEYLEDENWNEVWEKSFKPFRIDDFCYVMADFHPEVDDVDHCILINPKMAFGTGHHATTSLMMQAMKNLDLRHQNVLDFGTGTGILSILARKMGAEKIVAFDNDKNAFENAKDNFIANDIEDIALFLGTADVLHDHKYDIILANINLNILLDNLQPIREHMKEGGTLILSGILDSDVEEICQKYGAVGFKLRDELFEDGWAGLVFELITLK